MTYAERKKVLEIESVWSDSRQNMVQIVEHTEDRVRFKILYIDDHIPKNVKEGRVQVMPMEDRIESMRIENFMARGTGFVRCTRGKNDRNKNW